MGERYSKITRKQIIFCRHNIISKLRGLQGTPASLQAAANTTARDTLQLTAAQCNTMQKIATNCIFPASLPRLTLPRATHRNILQHTATNYITLLHTSVLAHCS